MLVLLLLLSPGCMPMFSDLQRAQLLAPAEVELTAHVGTYGVIQQGHDERHNNVAGLMLGVGHTPDVEWRARYRRSYLVRESGGARAQVLSGGPKFRLRGDHLSLYVPVGVAFETDASHPDDNGSFDTFAAVAPTVLIGTNTGEFSVRGSLKLHLQTTGWDDAFVAANVGLCIPVGPVAALLEFGVAALPTNLKGIFAQGSFGIAWRFGGPSGERVP
ncbi:MAG: hypothetical protein KC502_21340 [Myxococcales bacterium]|nr:hypothetical protein [Myxococcales bacterium]